MAKRDYYEVLGVDRKATDAQIKSAYRKQARKFHPDVNKASDAAAKFREATEAYEVLGDAQKRAQYDQFGHAGPGYAPGGGGPGRGRPQGWPGGGQGVEFNVEDIFGRGGQGFAGMSLQDILEAMGGGARGRRGAGRSRRPAERGEDLEYHLNLDFLQAVRGTTTSIRIQSPDGSSETINVKIPAGVHEGSRVRVREKGAPGPGGNGDLYIVCHVGAHVYFRREDNDIYVDVPISIVEAALGAKVDVPTLESTMTVTIPPGTGSGRKLRLKGRGVASPGGQAGDEYVVIKVVPPPSVSPKGAQLLQQFQENEPFDPRSSVPWK